MANKNKAKGTRAESALVKFFKDHGWEAERKALTGKEDHGDIKARGPRTAWYTIEVKAGKQTSAPSRSQLEEWLRQSRVEANNSNENLAVLCIVRYHRPLKDADIYLQYYDGDGYFTRAHMFLDEFIDNYHMNDWPLMN